MSRSAVENEKKEPRLNLNVFLPAGYDVWLSLDFQPLLASGANLNLALVDEQILDYRQICQRFEEKRLAVWKRT